MRSLTKTALFFNRYFSSHGNLVRKPYKLIGDADTKYFQSILGSTNVLLQTANENLDGYNHDWLNIYKGNSQVVLRPKTTEQVSEILKYCNKEKIAIVPQGGNTGLVGGSVPVFDEVILNMSLMNTIYSINEEIGYVTCQAGVVLKTLDDYAAQHGRIVPLDLGAKESCQIGGNLSTNAGGIRLLRYGSLRGNVLAIQAVLPNGQIIDCSSPLRKDNTGIDLKQLFVGSEGTLGVITKVSLLCPPRPKFTNVAMFGCENMEKVIHCLKQAQSQLCEILSAFELMDRQSMQCTEENLGLKNPLSSEHRYFILIETSGSNEKHDAEKLESFCQYLIENGDVADGIVAQDKTQVQNLWHIRESIAEAFVRCPSWFPLDVSLTQVQDICDLEHKLNALMIELNVSFSFFGHAGDGNLHLNFVSEKFDEDVKNRIEPFVYEWVAAHQGSISAEHGLGQMKAPYLHYSKSPETIEWMRSIKKMFDPNEILNPYKFLPALHKQ